jgi:hypothetical protein
MQMTAAIMINVSITDFQPLNLHKKYIKQIS